MCPESQRGSFGTPPRGSRSVRWLVAFMLVAVLLSGLGFVYKLSQFVRESENTEATAFLFPVVVYLIMAAGFVCLLIWAAIRGMFHNIEGPKFRMLEREEQYDREGV